MQKILRTTIAVFLMLPLLLSCHDSNNDSDPIISIEKITPILTQINSEAALATESSAVLGTQTTLAFHFLMPLDTTLSDPRSIPPWQSTRGVPLDGITIVDTVSEDLAGMRHTTVKATVLLPSVDLFGPLSASITANGVVPLVYRLLYFDGEKDMELIGSFPAYTDRSKAASQANFSNAAITLPAADGLVPNAAVDIAASFTNPLAEVAQSRWYVSGSAVVTDRRSLATKLTLPAAGAYTLVFTVKGESSGAAALRIRNLSVN